jgi:hypothetical protein
VCALVCVLACAPEPECRVAFASLVKVVFTLLTQTSALV